jgi:predicted TIM-barrel fold metal-dependent hydrolase
MRIIDVWMQHPTLRFLQHEMFESLRRWTGQQLPAEEVPLDLTLAAMDEAGVARGMICAWYDASGPLISNDEVAAWVAAHPDRLTGGASVDIRNPRLAVAELRRAVNDLGFRALRIVPWLWGLPPSHRLYYPLFSECIELGIPFMTQVGHTGPLRSSETGRPWADPRESRPRSVPAAALRRAVVTGGGSGAGRCAARTRIVLRAATRMATDPRPRSLQRRNRSWSCPLVSFVPPADASPVPPADASPGGRGGG